MSIKKITNWVRDYFYLTKGYSFMLLKPPKHYLSYVLDNKLPIVLIPGFTTKVQFLKAIADPISLKGHPIYVVEKLGYNTKTI